METEKGQDVLNLAFLAQQFLTGCQIHVNAAVVDAGLGRQDFHGAELLAQDLQGTANFGAELSRGFRA